MTINFRTVLYTYDLEPITVLELSAAAKQHLERYGQVILPVPEEPRLNWVCADHPATLNIRQVAIYAERFVRNGKESFLLFTRDDENALLLKAAFLPGQQKHVQDERAEAFAKGFLKAVRAIGNGLY